MAVTSIRPAAPDDVPVLLALIRELADYERAAEQVHATEVDLRGALFGDAPATFCQVGEVDGAVAGLALWFLNYSTWTGKHGIYLEDLFVRPAARGLGLGRALLADLARIARERGYPRVEWSVLDWNQPAAGFYRAVGAVPMSDWTVWRLSGDALAAGPLTAGPLSGA